MCVPGCSRHKRVAASLLLVSLSSLLLLLSWLVLRCPRRIDHDPCTRRHRCRRSGHDTGSAFVLGRFCIHSAGVLVAWPTTGSFLLLTCCVVSACQTFGDGLVAVVSGVVAEGVSATFGSPIAVFDLAASIAVLVGVAALGLWEENFGRVGVSCVCAHSSVCGLCLCVLGGGGRYEEVSACGLTFASILILQEKVGSALSLSDLSAAVGVLRDKPEVLLLGLVQSLFEAAMFCFVLLWVPMLSHANEVSGGDKLPIGLLFACLMVCIMLGSSLYEVLRNLKLKPVDIAWVRRRFCL